MQDDIDIAIKAKEHRIPTLFVRSKSDDVCIFICIYTLFMLIYTGYIKQNQAISISRRNGRV
jgi:hypothetical protein